MPAPVWIGLVLCFYAGFLIGYCTCALMSANREKGDE